MAVDKYASKAARSYLAASALNQPLLSNKHSRTGSVSSSDESHDFADDSDDEDARTFGPHFFGKDLVPNVALGLLAAGGLAASAAAMIALPGAIVLAMGGVCVLNAPTIVAKHLHIRKNDGIRLTVNKVSKQRAVLEDGIGFLSNSVADLQEETNLLKDFEESLREIATKAGVNVDAIVDLVNENEDVLHMMKCNLKNNFVQAMIKVVMRSDKDGDMKIDKREVPLLSLRLQIELEPYGISLDSKMFENMVREDNDVANILKFCGKLMFEGEDNDGGASVDSDDGDEVSETIGLEAFCKSLGEECPMTFEEKLGMITASDKFSKGSVEVARGSRMSLVATKNKKDVRRKTIMKQAKKRQSSFGA